MTADGSADVFGYGEAIEHLMVNHADGRDIWDVLYRVAEAGRFAVLPVGCGTLVPAGRQPASLPADVPHPALVVSSGAEMVAAITSG